MDKEIIRTKQEPCWHSAMLFFTCFSYLEIMQDEGFCALYRQLYDYVADKIKLQSDRDILDKYVVVEQTK